MFNLFSINPTLQSIYHESIKDASEWLPEYAGYTDAERQELSDFGVASFEDALESLYPEILVDIKRSRIYHPENSENPVTMRNLVDANEAVTGLWELKYNEIRSRNR